MTRLPRQGAHSSSLQLRCLGASPVTSSHLRTSRAHWLPSAAQQLPAVRDVQQHAHGKGVRSEAEPAHPEQHSARQPAAHWVHRLLHRPIAHSSCSGAAFSYVKA